MASQSRDPTTLDGCQWTVRSGQLAEEWLVIQHEYGRRYAYALSNAPAITPVDCLAWLKCVRHFVERSNQDAKSESCKPLCLYLNCRPSRLLAWLLNIWSIALILLAVA